MRRPEASFASPFSASVAAQWGEAVRKARLHRNLTQADFAQRARMSVATLQRVERGDTAVSFTSWLSAMEAGALLPALQAAADASVQSLGPVVRVVEPRQRASRPRRQASALDSYAF